MATKYYCDGCDLELSVTAVKHINVLVAVGADQNRTPAEYELCDRCVGRLQDHANPKKWVRCMPEALAKRASGF